MKSSVSFSASASRSGFGRREVRAFTVLELLAVIAVVCAGALTLAPALARTKPNVRAFQCLENLRRLQGALAMYSHDNHDLLPPNPDDGNTLPGYEWVAGDVSGGMPPGSPAFGSDMTNPNNLTDPTLDLIGSYLGRNPAPFKCPADPRYGLYHGPNPSLRGTIIPAVRSVSMNQGVGTIDAEFSASGAGHSGKPTLPTNGPWLTGDHSANRAGTGPYATFGRMTDFGFASPGAIFVLVDENPWSINDASLAVIAGESELIDYPASYHNNGASFSFADGHVESHQWLSTVMALGGDATLTSAPPGTLAYEDWYWLASHATKNLRTGNVP
jgi:prepilin-type processing-associated H-X9-DG protein